MGYADHTHYDSDIFMQINGLAFILGVRIFEKHIVITKGEKRTDYETGVNFVDFIRMREELEKNELILGNGNIFKLNEKEVLYKNREKKIVFAKNIPENSILTLSDLSYKVSNENTYFEQKDIIKLIGKKVRISCKKNETVKYEHIENGL